MNTYSVQNTPTLKTSRLILRRFTKADAEDILLLLSDENVNRFLPMFPLKSISEAEEYLKESYLDTYEAEQGHRFAVCLKEDNRPIGYVCVSDKDSHDFGYALLKEHWGKGIITEAALAVIEMLKISGFGYITATHDINNPASGAVMKKIGMVYKYSYVEQWQPKNIPVTFRMYQLNLDKNDNSVYKEYWDKYPEHFIENL